MPHLSPFTSHFSPFPAALRYNSALSLWLSVDPLSNKYPNLSPYTYCANNPVRLVDPDGREVVITGDAADKAVKQLQTKNLTISRDEKNGRLSVSGEAVTKEEKQLVAAINSTEVTVNVHASSSKTIIGEFGTNGGSFGGTIIKEVGKNKTAIVTQYVNPDMLSDFDQAEMSQVGQTMKHEVTEGYHAGKLSLKYNRPAPAAFSDLSNRDRKIYNAAHNLAIPQAWATEEQLKARAILQKNQNKIKLILNLHTIF